MDPLVLVANVVFGGAVVLVWVVLAIRDAGTSRPARIRGTTGLGETVLAVAGVAAILILGRRLLAPFTVDALWVRLIGLAIFVGSSAFAIWARLTLGRAWSIGPRAATEDGLRTDGPYAITRHPIYSGLLGMLVGDALMAGLGQWIVLILAGSVVLELKIRSEERLLLATFPSAYRTYQARVPQLVPGWHPPSVLRRRPWR